MFNHVELDLPKLSRETIDGVRYYSVPDEDELLKLVSITSVTSHFNRQIFINWRKKLVTKKQIVLQRLQRLAVQTIIHLQNIF